MPVRKLVSELRKISKHIASEYANGTFEPDKGSIIPNDR